MVTKKKSADNVSVGAAMTGDFYFENMMLLTASAMFTATSSCFVLGRIAPATFPFHTLSIILMAFL